MPAEPPDVGRPTSWVSASPLLSGLPQSPGEPVEREDSPAPAQTLRVSAEAGGPRVGSSGDLRVVTRWAGPRESASVSDTVQRSDRRVAICQPHPSASPGTWLERQIRGLQSKTNASVSGQQRALRGASIENLNVFFHTFHLDRAVNGTHLWLDKEHSRRVSCTHWHHSLQSGDTTLLSDRHSREAAMGSGAQLLCQQLCQVSREGGLEARTPFLLPIFVPPVPRAPEDLV